MPCVVLHVSGRNLQPEAMLSQVTFQAYSVHHVGDSQGSERRPKVFEDAGFSVALGAEESTDAGDLRKEIELAQSFLDRHYEELKQITGADDLRFDFGYQPRLDAKGRPFFAQFDYFPPRMLRQCGELGIGIELSLYPVPERQEEDSQD